MFKNNYLPILIADVKGYLNLLIVFPMYFVLSNKQRMLEVLRILFNVIVFLSAVSIILSYYQLWDEKIKMDVYEFVHRFGWASLTVLTENVTRVLLHSGTRMLFLGLLLGFAILSLEDRHKNIRYIQMASCLIALFISYARAMYLGAFLVVGFLLIIIYVFYKQYLKYALNHDNPVLLCYML